jgi:hypothetical protein
VTDMYGDNDRSRPSCARAVDTDRTRPSGARAVDTDRTRPSGARAVDTDRPRPSGARAVDTDRARPSGARAVDTDRPRPSGARAVDTDRARPSSARHRTHGPMCEVRRRRILHESSKGLEACASASKRPAAYLKVEDPSILTPTLVAHQPVAFALALPDVGHALRSANALTSLGLITSEYAIAEYPEASGGCPPTLRRRVDIPKRRPPECTAKSTLSITVIARDGPLGRGRLWMRTVRASNPTAIQGYPRGSAFQR